MHLRILSVDRSVLYVDVQVIDPPIFYWSIRRHLEFSDGPVELQMHMCIYIIYRWIDIISARIFYKYSFHKKLGLRLENNHS